MFHRLHQSLRGFGSLKGSLWGIEARLIHRDHGTHAAPDYSANYDADPATSRRSFEGMNSFAKNTTPYRWSMFNILGRRIGTEANLQIAEDTTMGGIGAIAAETQSNLHRLNPYDVEKSVGAKLNETLIRFDATGSSTPGPTFTPADCRIEVDFTAAYWQKLRTEDEIAKDLAAAANPVVLKQEYGLVDSSLKLICFSKEQAAAVAKLLMVRYAGGMLGAGGVSGANKMRALQLLHKNPKLSKKLEIEHHDEVGPLKAKYIIAGRVFDALSKMDSQDYSMNFEDVKAERKNIKEDLENIADKTKKGKVKSAFLPTSKVGFPTYDEARKIQSTYPDTFDKRMERIEEEEKRLDKIVKYYKSIAESLEVIYQEIKHIPSATLPSTIEALFDKGHVKPDKLDCSAVCKPGSLVAALTKQLGLKKSEDYLKEIDTAEAHAKEHHENPNFGAKSVIEIYKENAKNEYFKQNKTVLDDKRATIQAAQEFFLAEVLAPETEHLHTEIDRHVGGAHGITAGIAKGMWSRVKGVFTGSDEAYITGLAESPQVQVPRGYGTAATTWREYGIEGAKWAAGGAAIGAGTMAAVAGTAAIGLAGPLFLPLAAGAGAAAYALAKVKLPFIGPLDRRFIGTRAFAFLWPRGGARPDLNLIKNNRRSLETYWDGLRQASDANSPTRELNSTWYVRDTMREVGRTLLTQRAMQFGQEMGEAALDDKAWAAFNLTDKRREIHEYASKMVHQGFGAANTVVAQDTTKAMAYAGGRGSIRRSIYGGISSFFTEKS